jgi:hypothetical protein
MLVLIKDSLSALANFPYDFHESLNENAPNKVYNNQAHDKSNIN